MLQTNQSNNSIMPLMMNFVSPTPLKTLGKNTIVYNENLQFHEGFLAMAGTRSNMQIRTGAVERDRKQEIDDKKK